MKRAFALVAVVAAGALLAAFVVAPDRVVLRRDLRVERARPPAVFSHWSHDAAGCWSCHPGLFPAGGPAFGHKEIKQGLACGACHDGRRATAFSKMKCEACHAR